MIRVETFNLNMTSFFKPDPVTSTCPSEEEKKLSTMLSESIIKQEQEWLNGNGFMRINFDLKKRGNKVTINGFYYVQENGQTIFIPSKHKFMLRGQTVSTNLLDRVSAMVPFAFVDAFNGVKRGLTESFASDVTAVTAWTFVTGALLSLFGIDVIILFAVMFLMAALDGFLAFVFQENYDSRVQESENLVLQRLFLFAFMMALFIGLSVCQLGIEYVIWKNQGMTLRQLLTDAPTWVQRIGWMVNAQTLASLAIIGYYGNLMRKAFERVTGLNLLPTRKRKK